MRAVRVVTSICLSLALVSACDLSEPKKTDDALRLEELTQDQLRQLDPEKTVFFLTFGNIEVHGPHLPLGTDHFVALAFRDDLIERLSAAHPELTFVTYPAIPLGEGGVEELAGQWDHSGTFALRYRTLRDIAIDLGSEIARNGFKQIFLINAHGGFLHNLAFTEAAEFVSDHFDVLMVNIGAYVFAEAFYNPDILEAHFGSDWADRIGIFHHAGAPETAQILHLREDLVSSSYANLPAFIAHDMQGIFDVSESTGWQGYWGEPKYATRELGVDLTDDLAMRGFRIAEMALSGEDLSNLPIYPETFLGAPEARAYFEAGIERYEIQTQQIEAWLEENISNDGQR